MEGHHKVTGRAACLHYLAEQSGIGLELTHIQCQIDVLVKTFSGSSLAMSRKEFHWGPSSHLVVLAIMV